MLSRAEGSGTRKVSRLPSGVEELVHNGGCYGLVGESCQFTVCIKSVSRWQCDVTRLLFPSVGCVAAIGITY